MEEIYIMKNIYKEHLDNKKLIDGFHRHIYDIKKEYVFRTITGRQIKIIT